MTFNPAVRGAALIIVGMVLLGFTDNYVRVIAGEIGLWQFHLVRTAMAMPLLGVFAWAAGLQLRPLRVGLVTARCAVQAAAMLIYFGALAYMPIAQVGAGLFTAPLFVLVFSAAFFGHRIGPRRIAAGLLGFSGILIVLRPDPGNLTLLTAMPLAAGALYGLSNLLTREWCRDEPAGALVAGFFLALGLAGATASLVLWMHPATDGASFLTRPWAAPSATVLFWVAVQAAGSLAAVACITKGYQAADTSYLAVFEYSFLITASGWAWLLWREQPDAMTGVGIALIIGSGAIISRCRGVTDDVPPTNVASARQSRTLSPAGPD